MNSIRLSDEIPRPNYILIDSVDKFEDLKQSMANTARCSFDYETTSIVCDSYMTLNLKQRPKVDLIRAKITSCSFRTSDGKCYYLSVKHRNSFNFPKEAVAEVLRLKPKDAPLAAHNMAFEWLITKKELGIDLRDLGPLRDTMIAAKVADSNQNVGLKELSLNRLGIIQQTYEDVTKGRTMEQLTALEAFHYGCDDSELQWELDEQLEKELVDTNLMDYYLYLEMPIVPIVSEMTLRGAYTTRELVATKTSYHQAQMARVEAIIFDMIGKEVNLNSPVAMSRILYEELGIPRPPYAESTTMTDKESLYWNIDAHEIMKYFIEWKKFNTRYKLYDKPYAGLIHNDTGMLHSTLKALADTSRFTSSSPNLQQLAKRGDGIEVRELFIPPPGYDFIMAYDMSQVELVIAAHRSQSPVLLNAYGKVRGDIHTTTCCSMFEITADIAKANKTYRTAGKTANFSLLYGGATKRIYRLIKLELAKMGLAMPFTMRDVDDMIYRYFMLYPEIRQMQKADVAYARENGYVKSLFGRRFYLPDIFSRNSYIRSKQERKATNSPIQGTCAELLKRAIIRIYDERIPVEDAVMWASIHDENVFYVKDKAVKDVSHIVHKHMSDTPEGMLANMESEGTIGKDFANLTDISKFLEEQTV